MKDLLEILIQAGTLPTSILSLFIGCAFVYVAYGVWKNHFSETTILEVQKKRMELVKLALEVEALQKQNQSTLAEKPLGDLLNILKKKTDQSVSEAKPSARKVFKKNPRLISSLLTGAFWASVYPLVSFCYTLLHPSPDMDSAQALRMLCYLQLSLTAITAILGAIGAVIIGARSEMDDFISNSLVGIMVGMISFPLLAHLLVLILKLAAVFLQAH